MALAVIAFAACKKSDSFKDPSPGGFADKTAMGMYDSGLNTVVALDKANDQIAYVSTALESRLQDNTPNVLMRCRLDVAPTERGQSVTVELTGKSVTAGSYAVTVVKKTSDYIWLWCADQKVGFILYWPQ